MPTNLVEASLEDLPALGEISVQAGYPAWGAKQLREEFERAHAYLWCMRLAGKAVAFALYWLIAGEAELLQIVVSPNYRRRGLAQRLLGQSEEELQKLGAETIYLEVAERNKPARRLYEQLGFEQMGLRKNYYPARGGTAADHAVLLSKALS